MNALPADPYLRDAAGAPVGHYTSLPLPGGPGPLRMGTAWTETWAGRTYSAEVVGFEAQGTNPQHRVIVRYRYGA